MANKKFESYLYLIPLILFIGSFFVWSLNFVIHDFANYYLGGSLILSGQFSTDVYDALKFNQILAHENIDGLYVNFYPNTPFIAFSMIPFNILEWQSAKILFNILSSGLFVLSVVRAREYYGISRVFLLLVPIIYFTSIKNNILFGQTYLLVFALLAEGLIQYERGKSLTSSLLWSIAILLKVFPVVLFAWLLLRKDLKTFAYLGFTCLLWIIVTLPFVGIEVWLYFITDVLPKSSAGLIYDGFTVKAKSAVMLFKNLFVFDEVINPDPVVDSELLFDLANAGFKALFVSVCVYATLFRQNKVLISFGFWIFASLMIGPTSGSYAKVLLLFPILVLFAQVKEKRKLVIGSVLCALVVNVPTSLFYDLDVIFAFPVLYLLIVFFIFLLVSIGLKFDWRYYTAVWVSFFLLGISRQTTTDYNYVMLNERHPLILSRLEVDNNHLVYYSWSVDGETRHITGHRVEEFSKAEVDIVGNNIFYRGEQITNSSDRKREAYLVNNEEIFFLSDLNRGEGCYGLRKISI